MAGLRARNRRVAAALALFVAAMVGLAYGSVPLYRLFCEATGYGGTPQRAETAPEAPAARTIAVRFDANVDPALAWTFQPVEREVVLSIGVASMVYYRARNLSAFPSTGRATFNVTPAAAGPYFVKIACFCFEEQRLAPGESADLPVQFFVDPAILDDPETAELAAITLSYTFFRSVEETAAVASGAAAP